MARSSFPRLLFLVFVLQLVSCAQHALVLVQVNNIPALADTLYVRVSTDDRVAPEYPRHDLRELLTGQPFAYRFGVQPVGASGRISVAVAIYDLQGCLMTAAAGEIELAAATAVTDLAPTLQISLPAPPEAPGSPCARPDPSAIVLRSFQQQDPDPTRFVLTGWGFSPGVSVRLDGQPLAAVHRHDLTRITGTLPLSRSPSGLRSALLEVQNPDGALASLRVSVYSLTFSTQGRAYEFPSGYQPTALRKVDLDQDGRPDLVVAGHAPGGGFLAVFRNPGGQLAAPVFNSVTIPIDHLELADLTDDGLLDAFVTSAATQYITILPGLGQGLFSVPNSSGFSQAGLQPGSLVVADLFGDSKPDLIVASNSLLASDGAHVSMFENVGGQLRRQFEIVFEATLQDLAAVDLDRDGILDLVVSGTQIVSFARQGSFWPLLHPSRLVNSWTVPSSTYTPRTDSPVLALDYNSDAYPDLIGTGLESSFIDTPTDTIGLFANAAFMRPGTFAKRGTTLQAAVDAYTLAAGDLDRDGAADLLVASYHRQARNKLAVLLRQGNQGNTTSPFPASSDQPTYDLGYGANQIATADLDGDGRLDVAVLSAGAAQLGQPPLLQLFLNTTPR